METKRTKAATNGHLDRLPPHDVLCEEALIGCMLLDRVCYNEVKESLHVKEAFYSLPCQIAFENLDERTDLIGLQSRLKDKQLLEPVGGIAWLSQCQDSVSSVANLPYWLGIVREKYLLRRMIQTGTEVVGRCFDFSGEIDTLMDEVERDILAVAATRKTQDATLIADCIQPTLDRIEYFRTNKGKVIGVPTGYHKLDFLMAGMRESEVIIIAARPSEGKTALAMNIAEHASISLGLPVGVFSLEMDKDAITFRMLCGRASVDSMKAKHGELEQEEMSRIAAAAGQVRKSQLFIDDTPGLTLNQVKGRARRMFQKHHIRLLIVDYLQLMSCPKRKGDFNRQQEVSEISCGIKTLAKELKIPILLLSQLNRVIEKEKGRKPRLSDLRESGAIEQDADVVLMPYNPKPCSDDEEEGEEIQMNLLIAKNRNGPRNRLVPLTFKKVFCRFENPSKKVED